MRGSVTDFKLADVRALLRLCNALHEAPADAVVRKRRLLEGLCELLDADSGVCEVSRSDGNPKSVVSVVQWTVSDEDVRDPAPTGRTSQARGDVGRAAHSDRATAHCIQSPAPVSGTALRACVTLLRRPPARRRFTRRDRALLDVFHREMAWLYLHELPAVSTDEADLPPRQRQTLRLLLGGLGEKEIARRLAVSPNTVHHHVKALYRHFHVSTRSELLARWVKE